MDKSFIFGGRKFNIEDINQVRHLALGAPVVADRWTFSSQRESLNRLKCMGYALVEIDGLGKYEKLTYRASDRLMELKARHDTTVVSFDTMARRSKKDISLAACRAVNRKHRAPSKASPLREFPTREAVLHRGLVEAQSPLFTQSSPIEPGDQFEFSSRGLTDWYVGEFCNLNLNHCRR